MLAQTLDIATAYFEIGTRLDDNIEAAREEDDFLSGILAIVEAIRSGQIQAHVYRQKTLHAKAYITHTRLDVVGSAALVAPSHSSLSGNGSLRNSLSARLGGDR